MDINSLISGQQGVGLPGRPLHGHSLQQFTEQHAQEHHHTDATAALSNPRPNLPPMYPLGQQQLQSAVVAPDQASPPLYASQRSPLSTTGHIHPTTQQISSLPHTAHTQTPNRRLAHILSEQKRRENINSGFEELKGIVPSCRGCADSKAVILRKAVHYIQFLETELQKVKQSASVSNSSSGSDPPSLSPRKLPSDSGASSSVNGVAGSRLSLSVPPSTGGAYGLPSETAMGEKQHVMPQHPPQTMRSPTQLHPPSHPHSSPHPNASPPSTQPPIFQPQPRSFGDTWRRSSPHQAHVNLNRQQQNGYDRDEHYKSATSRPEWEPHNMKYYENYGTASRAATGYHVSLKQEGALHRND